MKRCILVANLEGQGVVIKTVYHFVDSNLRVQISSKKEGLKEKGGALEVVLPRRGQISYLGEGRVCLGDQW